MRIEVERVMIYRWGRKRRASPVTGIESSRVGSHSHVIMGGVFSANFPKSFYPSRIEDLKVWCNECWSFSAIVAPYIHTCIAFKDVCVFIYINIYITVGVDLFITFNF